MTAFVSLLKQRGGWVPGRWVWQDGAWTAEPLSSTPSPQMGRVSQACKQEAARLGLPYVRKGENPATAGARLEAKRRRAESHKRQQRERAARLARAWARWVHHCGDEELALARLVRHLNRLAKGMYDAEGIYRIKAHWVRHNQHRLVSGRLERKEACGDLYYHEFEVAGERFGFHSYEVPRLISAEQGRDLAGYGRPPTAEECAEVARAAFGAATAKASELEDLARFAVGWLCAPAP